MRALTDLLICLGFFSRFPLPVAAAREASPAAFAEAAAMTSLAGALIGLVPAVVLLAATACGLPPLLSAPLAIAALVTATGALHEDGLADCTDGFGGGTTRERKLEIMRDSRIGTYGACALALSLYVRAFTVGTIATRSVWAAAMIVVFAASLSRVACLLPLVLLGPARSDGLGHGAGRPSSFSLTVALGFAIVIGSFALLTGATFAGLITALALALAAAVGFCGLAWTQIGGQTGDVAGATQQLAELAALLCFSTVA